jgi:phosphate transport system substrate-binding protein
MKKIFARAWVMICVFAAVCSISAAIGQDSAKKSLRVNGAGMASDQVEKWAKQFMQKNPEVSVTVIVSSAQRGFLSLLDGTAEIAIMSREIMPDERKKAAEKGLQIAESPVGHAAITLITHPRNPVNELTLDQLRKLYSGEYDNWKSVGGPDEPVTCLSRRVPESGGAVFFQEKVLGGVPFGAKTVFVDRWYSIIKICAEGRYLPIGIIPHTRDTSGAKVLRIKRDDVSPSVSPSEENVKSQTYPIILSFGFVWNAQTKDPAVQNFVDFCKGQGRTE